MKLNTASQRKQFLTEGELEELGLASRRTLQAWRLFRRGPPYVKVQRSVRYRVADIEAWLAAHAVSPADESERGATSAMEAGR